MTRLDRLLACVQGLACLRLALEDAGLRSIAEELQSAQRRIVAHIGSLESRTADSRRAA